MVCLFLKLTFVLLADLLVPTNSPEKRFVE